MTLLLHCTSCTHRATAWPITVHFPRYWPFVRGIHRSPVNSPHKGQWCGSLMFSLTYVWINGWVNSGEAGDLRLHHAHYDVTVMFWLVFRSAAPILPWPPFWLWRILSCIQVLWTPWAHQSLASINQSNPVLLKERVRIPRTRRAGGAVMLWGRLPLDGVGSCRLFFTDDLHDNLSWVPVSDKPHTFKSWFTHSSQVFFGRPGPFLPGTGLDLTLFISPLERMTCPNHLSRRSRTRMARSHIPSLACSSSIDGSSDGLTPQTSRFLILRIWIHQKIWRLIQSLDHKSISDEKSQLHIIDA